MLEGNLGAAETATQTTESTSPVTETATQEASSNGAPSSEEGDQSSTPPAPAYQPNLKFKFLNHQKETQEEREFDDFMKGVVKDADTEKKVRELYEKAYGLDHIKSHREKLRGEVENLRSENTDFKHTIQTLSGMVQKNDLDSFFDALAIPEDKVLRWALNRVEFHQRPKHEKEQILATRELEQRARQLEMEKEEILGTYQQTRVQTRAQQLDYALQNPNVVPLAQQFDARMGAGAFRNEVIARGILALQLSGKDLTAEEAVQEALRFIGTTQAAPQPAQTLSPTGAGQTQTQNPATAKPVIPNIPASGASPAKKIVKSIADLRKRAQEMG